MRGSRAGSAGRGRRSGRGRRRGPGRLGYVTVLPSSEKGAVLRDSTAPKGESRELNADEVKQKAGAKVGRKGNRYGLARTKVGGKSYSDVRKRTFYIKNGNVFVSDGSGWSYDEGVQK
jgi:hypothetical protein